MFRQTWRGCSSQRKGQVQGPQGRCPRGSGQGGRRAELGENEGSEGKDKAGGAWGHSSKKRRGRGGLMWSEVFNVSLLCFAENSKWGRVRAGTNEKATRRI